MSPSPPDLGKISNESRNIWNWHGCAAKSLFTRGGGEVGQGRYLPDRGSGGVALRDLSANAYRPSPYHSQSGRSRRFHERNGQFRKQLSTADRSRGFWPRHPRAHDPLRTRSVANGEASGAASAR